ncbi:hypothetical protein [Aestuariicoccus sp. MJ-SS9]|uniref:hypothetical protein n=1 Tax=Aestuariicoccus sp. MJ-SS9 TaxID=3079855 RepID=UPI00290B480D|nr:hypothetical protein [Aestuariicoccus sp. MJ-SS9]MDU8914093.1 hypothetical protein [Aestuariicoccus sp. MJ-SS9]
MMEIIMTAKSIALLSSLSLLVTAAAHAADTWPVQSRYTKDVTASLTLEGYTSIQTVNGNELLLSAYDGTGKRVLLTMHPDNGTIEATDFFNALSR